MEFQKYIDKNFLQAFVDIFRVISWLDDKKWEYQKAKEGLEIEDTFVKEIIKAENLKPAQKILAHWLIYITDRGKRADIVWENNTPKIKELVEEYFNSDLDSEEKVKKLFFEFNNKKKNKIMGYPADLESIKRTLIILLDYDKDIIKFMTRKLINWYRNYKDTFCSRIAFSLYLLSYKDVGSLARSEELINQNRDKLKESVDYGKKTLNNDGEFEDKFKIWNKGNNRWHKRLWAALRDYKKWSDLSEIFIKGIKNGEGREIWDGNWNEQLELPGDRWNERFFGNCIRPNLINMNISGKHGRIVREIWKMIKNKVSESNFQVAYPEQFDITFDFAPRMCDKKFCNICPFGPNGAEKICIPKEDKYCPVALIICEYIVKCINIKENCIIKNGIGKGRCKGVL